MIGKIAEKEKTKKIKKEKNVSPKEDACIGSDAIILLI